MGKMKERAIQDAPAKAKVGREQAKKGNNNAEGDGRQRKKKE